MNKGRIIQIMGPVIDINFEGGELPALYNAIHLKSPENENETIVLEVAQHLGDNSVRTVSMHPTDGLVRGQEAVDTGGPISVPVGEKVLGRILNVVGDPVDQKPPVESEERWSIHRDAPPFDEQDTRMEMLETGITKEEKQDFLEARVLAKPFLLWNSFAILVQSMEDTQYSLG